MPPKGYNYYLNLNIVEMDTLYTIYSLYESKKG